MPANQRLCPPSSRFLLAALLWLVLLLLPMAARSQNVEDEPIPDDVPAARPAPSALRAPQVLVAPPGAPDVLDANAADASGAASFDFLRQALYAGVLAALACGYVGVFVVLKRMAFIGVALAEMSSAGIALALLLGFSPLLGALGFMLAGVGAFSRPWASRRVPHETLIGALYVGAGALGILLVAKSAAGESHLLTLLQGNVLTVDPRETLQMLASFALVGGAHAVFGKEFVLVSFDREAAQTQGVRAGLWDGLLLLSIGVVIALSIRAVGTLMTTAMLLLPAATTLLLARHLRGALILSPLLAVATVPIGLYLSLALDLPASAVIVALSFALLLLALAWNAAHRT